MIQEKRTSSVLSQSMENALPNLKVASAHKSYSSYQSIKAIAEESVVVDCLTTDFDDVSFDHGC